MKITRREFIALLGGTAAAWPLAARAQQRALPVIGFLHGGSPNASEYVVAAFHKGLNETGYVEHQNVGLDYRWAEGQSDRLPALAADLVRRQVTVIVSSGGDAASFAAKAATSAIPIVFGSGGDPVRTGLVAPLDRPGGNLTGVTILASDLTSKRFGLFHDLVPNAGLIGLLLDSTAAGSDFAAQEVEAAALRLGVPIKVISAGTAAEIEVALAAFVRDGAGAVLVHNSFNFSNLSDRLSQLALRYRIPLSGGSRNFIDGGALMSYGPSVTDAYRKVGVYAGRILKGEKPGDLPVQLPTKFEFVINLKTAKALGLTVPLALQASADELIE
jgi:putative tryptophan/tyrosine transport system substrate-binding protein